MPTQLDFSALYDEHPEYIARRQSGSFEQAQIAIEVELFKLPNLLALLADGGAPSSVLEIGCATGELIAAMPVRDGGRRLGLDISAANVAVARERHPLVEFRAGDFGALVGESFDVVVLSDVLEHVPDDRGFLRDAATFGRQVLVNLPLEDNWLNLGRRYGPDDVSGHLRRYSLEDGMSLIREAGLEVLRCKRVWVHETPADEARRALRLARCGAAYGGGRLGRGLRRGAFAVSRALPAIGRRLFASNLFVAARARSAS